MPLQIEHEGKEITVYTQEDLDGEIMGLKITNDNLKNEKTELKDKLKTSEEAKRVAEEETATAKGDKATLERLAEERESEKTQELNELKNAIKSEKIGNTLNDVVTKLGLTGTQAEDVRDLLKMRVGLDYDTTTHSMKIDGHESLDSLVNEIKTSGRYDSYLPGSGATGGSSTGSQGAGGVTKKFNEYTGGELKAIKDSDPAAYDRIKSEYYGAS